MSKIRNFLLQKNFIQETTKLLQSQTRLEISDILNVLLSTRASILAIQFYAKKVKTFDKKKKKIITKNVLSKIIKNCK